jgi:putative phosphoribosyl transferase
MFSNRRSAGRQLAARLQQLPEQKPVVLALPRGGVPVGFEIAEGLDAPLDIVLVRKIGVPWLPELALGAVVDGADPQVIIHDILAAELAVDQNYITSETARQLEEIERRRKVYLVTGRPCRSPAGRSSSSMTGSPPAARYAPRFALSEGREPGKSSWRFRWHLGARSRNCERRSTRSFA